MSTGEAVERAVELAGRAGPRFVLGLAGAPGAGKSTLAARLAAGVARAAGGPSLDRRAAGWQSVGGRGPGRGSVVGGSVGGGSVGSGSVGGRVVGGRGAVVVPLDGFHLADVELIRLGRLGRKGAPDTFDAAGYVALLKRIRGAGAGEVVYAPAFGRRLEQPIAGSIPVLPGARLVITEGNYLLFGEPPWTEVRALLDEVWWVELDDEERRRRLVARHERWGKPAGAARQSWPSPTRPTPARSRRGATGQTGSWAWTERTPDG